MGGESKRPSFNCSLYAAGVLLSCSVLIHGGGHTYAPKSDKRAGKKEQNLQQVIYSNMPYTVLDNSKQRQNMQARTPRGRLGFDSAAKQYSTQMSKKLPLWMWLIIAQSLGIKTHPMQRPILATILYAISVLSATGLIFTTTWFVAGGGTEQAALADTPVTRGSSKSDMLDETIMIAVTVSWCLLGLYANSLAYRLYSSSRFLEMVRLHAKTILKVNAAFLMFLLLTVFVILNDYQAYKEWVLNQNKCLAVGIDPTLCQIRFASLCMFSVFALFYHSLIGVVIFSVCRTHVIEVRRFIKDLEKEAIIYEKNRFSNAPVSETMWLSDHDADKSSDSDSDKSKGSKPSFVYLKAENPEQYVPQEKAMDPTELSSTATFELNCPPAAPLPETAVIPSCENMEMEYTMSTAVILQRYWKLSCAMRMASSTFQRWTMSVMTLAVAFVALTLIKWLSHSPHPIEIGEVILPLLLLPLLCSAYAEVNVEGKRLVKCICPMEERLSALFVMHQAPPEMTVFGVPLSYSAIGTFAAGLLLAFSSRVVLKELGTNP